MKYLVPIFSPLGSAESCPSCPFESDEEELQLTMSVFALQGTMPSTLKHPSHVPMWKGVKVAYVIVPLCLYPIAIGGFWAYGNQVCIFDT
jgi:hypothetical protein